MPNIAHSSEPRNAPADTGRPQATSAHGDGAPPTGRPGPDFERIQQSGEFTVLRSRLRRFVFPMSLLFFAWYMTYVLLAAYAHTFMSIKVFGEVNVAIILGLLQFVSTIVVTGAYIRFANRRLDPQAEAVRRQAGVPNP